jgi:hypothetical protein
VFELPFTWVSRPDSEPQESIQTTLGQILRDTADWRVGSVYVGFAMGPGRPDGVYEASIDADSKAAVVASTHFNCELLKRLIDFRSGGVNPALRDVVLVRHGPRSRSPQLVRVFRRARAKGCERTGDIQ